MRQYYCYLVFLILTNYALSQSQEQLNYFPLNVGDTWVLSNKQYQLKITVFDTIHICSRVFYKVQESSSINNSSSITRKRLYAYDSSGNVYRKVVIVDSSEASMQSIKLKKYIEKELPIDSSIIGVWYKTNASVKDTWKLFANSQFESREIHPYKIILESRCDTVITPNRTYYNCLRFYIEDLQESDTEYWDWLAEGVGLVKRKYLSTKAKGFILTSFKVSKNK